MSKVNLKLVHPRWVPGTYTAWVPWFNTILYDREQRMDKNTVAHELVHVDQWNRYGIFFPIRYAMAWLGGGRTHSGNWMEKEADELASEKKYREKAAELIGELDASRTT